jgi:MoaA/NifB/PqqE/SkfB family radical SAM enzyme
MDIQKSFRFTSDMVPGIPFSVAELRAAADGARLSPQDREVVDDMVATFEKTGELPFPWTPQEHLFFQRDKGAHLVDYLVYRYKVRVFPQRQIVADFPTYLLIEPMSACNLRCTMCFQVDKTFTKKPYMGGMDLDLYREIVDQAAAGGTRAITFASRGEPTMNKGFGEMLSYAAAKKSFFEIKVNTNGTKLTERLSHEILQAGTAIVVVSIESIEAADYARIRVGGDFNEVLANVKRLREIRDREYPSSPTEIRVSGVKVKKDFDEARFNDFWAPITDTVALVDLEERWDTYANDVQPDLKSPCFYLWERMYVWYDGICNPCDLDYKSELAIGNAKEHSLAEIWHGPAYTRLREKHRAGKRAEYVPCDRCGSA